MPGAYAHITVVNEFRNTDKLLAIPDFPKEAVKAFLRWFKFAELGAVSPDYPYLAVGNSDAAEWADLMHYTHTGIMVQEGTRLLRAIAGEKKYKCLAWLLGYASHVTADVTVHPVVELKVGTYTDGLGINYRSMTLQFRNVMTGNWNGSHKWSIAPRLVKVF